MAAGLKIHVLSDVTDIVTDVSENNIFSIFKLRVSVLSSWTTLNIRTASSFPLGCISHTACAYNYIFTAKFENFYTIYPSVPVQVAPAVASQALSWCQPPTNGPPHPPGCYLPASHTKQFFSNPTYNHHILPRTHACVLRHSR